MPDDLEIPLKPDMEYVGIIYYEDGTADSVGISKSDKEQFLRIIYNEELDKTNYYVKDDVEERPN